MDKDVFVVVSFRNFSGAVCTAASGEEDHRKTEDRCDECPCLFHFLSSPYVLLKL